MQRSGGMGSTGNCVCLGCGANAPHSPGVPCREQRCPTCGKAMVREGSAHHQAYLAKRAGAKKNQ